MEDVRVFMKKIDERINAIKKRFTNYYFKKYNINFNSFGRGLKQLM